MSKKIVIYIICFIFLCMPVLSSAEAEREGMEIGRHIIEKHMEKHLEESFVGKVIEKGIEHGDKIVVGGGVTTGTVGLQPAGHKPIAVIAASGKASSTFATVLTSIAVYGVFAAILAYHIIYYHELNKHPAFEGQAWDTCANAIRYSETEHLCKKHGFIH